MFSSLVENMLKQLQHPVGSSLVFRMCFSWMQLYFVAIVSLYRCGHFHGVESCEIDGSGGIIVSKSAKCIGISFCLLSFLLPFFFFVYHNYVLVLGGKV